MDIFGTVLVAFFATLFPTTTTPVAETWECAEPLWEQGPKVESGVFRSKLTVTCKGEAQSGGGILSLEKHANQLILENAEEVHSGPIQKEYLSTPATWVDVTVKLEERITSRGENWVATDGLSLTQLFDSKKIVGEGVAAYIKDVDMGYYVETTREQNVYSIKLSVYTEVNKPPFISEKMFLKQATQEVEKQFEENKPKAMSEILSNL